MPPVKTAVPPQAVPVYDAYLACLAARGVGNKTFESGARCFLARFPDPQAWAALPLAARLAGTRPHLQPLLNFLMLHGHLRPGYDYLLDGKLTAILRVGEAGQKAAGAAVEGVIAHPAGRQPAPAGVVQCSRAASAGRLRTARPGPAQPRRGLTACAKDKASD